MKRIALIASLAALSTLGQAAMRITEWMYSGNDGEYIEFTNVSDSSVDMTGWSFDDNSRTPGSQDLSGFGLVAAHESVILSELDAATFMANWSLSGVKVIGLNANNLGRADEINLYNGTTLVDRLTYDDVNGKGPRTQNISGNVPLTALGLNDATKAVASSVGDAYGSWIGKNNDIGNPGTYPNPVPEPATLVVLGLAALVAARRRSL